MAETMTVPTSEMSILRRVVDPEQPFWSADAARAILRLRFSAADRGADEPAGGQEPFRKAEAGRSGRA